MTIKQLHQAINLHKDKPIVYYEFGVYEGNTALAFKRYCIANKIWLEQMNLFDSFRGLPDEHPGVSLYRGFQEGEFKPTKSIEDIVKRIREDDDINMNMVPGFFEDSLKDSIVEELGLKPASIIGLDADLYISTIQALDFMLRNNLYHKGTILAYDEWNSVPGGGEELAHAQKCIQYGIECKQVFEGICGNVMVQKNFEIQ